MNYEVQFKNECQSQIETMRFTYFRFKQINEVLFDVQGLDLNSVNRVVKDNFNLNTGLTIFYSG